MGKRSSGFIYFWIFVYQQNIWNEKYIFEWYIFFLTYFIDGKTFVCIIYFWIFVYQQNICLSTKYLKWKIHLWMIYFFFNLFYRWENVRLDFFNFGWYIFSLTYFIKGKTVRSVVYGWLQSHIWGGSMRGIGSLRILDRKWPEVT
jgi:hypothetical protein